MLEAFKFVQRAIPRFQKFRNRNTQAKSLLEEAETQHATIASVCQAFAATASDTIYDRT